MFKKFYFTYSLLILVLLLACHKGDKVSKIDKGVLQEKTEEVKAVVKENVSDPDKQKQVIKLIDENSKVIQKYYDERMAYKKKGTKLNRNYDATEAQFRKLLYAHDREYEVMITTLIKNRNSMRDLMTDEEWDNVNDHFLKVSN